jgi:hypothetical protein
MTFTPSERWLVIVAMGFLNWLLTFMLALCLMPFEIQSYQAGRIALSVVIVIVSGCCAWAYLLQTFVARRREGMILGLSWTLIALVLDYPSHWLIEGVSPLAYGKHTAPYLLLILLTCGTIGFALRYAEVRRASMHAKRNPPFYGGR